MTAPDPDAETAFDHVSTAFDPPLLVVTTSDGHEQAGCIVGFHTQCSIEPLRYALWLSKANRTYRVALQAEYLGVHVLGAQDRDLGAWFGGHTGDEEDTFAGVDVDPGPGGVPLLRGVPGRFAGRRVALFDDDGDHACFVLEVEQGSAEYLDRDQPLLRVSSLADIEPGHPS